MKLAIVAGGWHWPLHFYETVARTARGADLFVVAHRSPELKVVREEKREILAAAKGPLADLDRELYAAFPTYFQIVGMGWQYAEAPNTVGDWGFFNQWLERSDFRQYDVILNCHDDSYIRRDDLFSKLSLTGWLMLANGRYPQAPAGYVRGSFEFWKPELIEMLGGRIDLGEIRLSREGQTDSPAGLQALSEWNNTCVPLRDFMVQRRMQNRIAYLSSFYRVSPWVIAGERGFMHYNAGAPWSFEAGMAAMPLLEAVACK